jgi:hypothetical protein
MSTVDPVVPGDDLSAKIAKARSLGELFAVLPPDLFYCHTRRTVDMQEHPRSAAADALPTAVKAHAILAATRIAETFGYNEIGADWHESGHNLSRKARRKELFWLLELFAPAVAAAYAEGTRPLAPHPMVHEVDELLELARDLDARATPGRWHLSAGRPMIIETIGGKELGSFKSGADAIFVTEARTRLPQLVKLLDYAKRKIDAMGMVVHAARRFAVVAESYRAQPSKDGGERHTLSLGHWYETPTGQLFGARIRFTLRDFEILTDALAALDGAKKDGTDGRPFDRRGIPERQVPDHATRQGPLSCKDPTAQDLLWFYAQRRRAVDATFADDLEAALLNAGYVAPAAPLVEDAAAAAAPAGDRVELLNGARVGWRRTKARGWLCQSCFRKRGAKRGGGK